MMEALEALQHFEEGLRKSMNLISVRMVQQDIAPC